MNFGFPDVGITNGTVNEFWEKIFVRNEMGHLLVGFYDPRPWISGPGSRLTYFYLRLQKDRQT